MSLSLSSALAQDATATPEAEATAETTSATSTSTNLVYSVPSTGEISDANPTQIWTLATASADRLSVRVERTGGNLLPDVQIMDTNSQQLSTSYGPDRTGAVALIENYTLPAAGTFQIMVQRKDGESGVTAGTYSITVTPLGTALDNPNNSTVISEITPDTPISGEITGAHWYHRYTYNAQGKDVINIVAHRTGGTLYPQIELLDANGSSLNTGYTDYSGDIAEIQRAELPGPGTYTVVVDRQSDYSGDTIGNYDLTLSVIGLGEESPALAQNTGTVEYDTALTGEINSVWYQDWALTAQAGDTLTLTVTRGDGNLQPEVILLGGSGQEVTHGYTDRTGASATIDHYQLQAPGTYTVRVSRYSGKNGYSSGAYTLMVEQDGAGADSPALKTPTGTVVDGTPAEGEITGGQWANVWTYQGKKGVVMTFEVERTSGTLIPRIDVRDANGQILYSGYADASAAKATIASYALPGDGQYQVVVLRDGDQNGYTTGGYILTIKPAS